MKSPKSCLLLLFEAASMYSARIVKGIVFVYLFLDTQSHHSLGFVVRMHVAIMILGFYSIHKEKVSIRVRRSWPSSISKVRTYVPY